MVCGLLTFICGLLPSLFSITGMFLVVFGCKAFKIQSTKKVFATTLFHSGLIKMVHPNGSGFKILNWKRSQDIVNRAYEENQGTKALICSVQFTS